MCICMYTCVCKHTLPRPTPTRTSPLLTPKTSSHWSSLIHFHSHNHELLPSSTTTSQVQPLLPVGRFHVNVGPKALMRPRVMLGLRAWVKLELGFKGWLRLCD